MQFVRRVRHSGAGRGGRGCTWGNVCVRRCVVIGQAAAIQDALTRAGLGEAQVAWWWGRPRAQLDGMTPRELAERAGAPAVGARLLELARCDVFELGHELPGADELARAAALAEPEGVSTYAGRAGSLACAPGPGFGSRARSAEASRGRADGVTAGTVPAGQAAIFERGRPGAGAAGQQRAVGRASGGEL